NQSFSQSNILKLLDSGLPWLSDQSQSALIVRAVTSPSTRPLTASRRRGQKRRATTRAGSLSSNSNGDSDGYAYSWDEEERLLTVTINGSYDLRFFHLFDAHDRIVVRLPRGNVELFTRKEAVAFGPVDLKIATLDLIDLGAARVASGARSEADWIALPDAKALGVLP